jgi:RNA polymerase sigma-70 factor (ECF subfamily)
MMAPSPIHAMARVTNRGRTFVARWRACARDRELLWLAYAQGSSHREIADSLGLKTASIKLLLFRARRRLAKLLRGHGHAD